MFTECSLNLQTAVLHLRLICFQVLFVLRWSPPRNKVPCVCHTRSASPASGVALCHTHLIAVVRSCHTSSSSTLPARDGDVDRCLHRDGLYDSVEGKEGSNTIRMRLFLPDVPALDDADGGFLHKKDAAIHYRNMRNRFHEDLKNEAKPGTGW